MAAKLAKGESLLTGSRYRDLAVVQGYAGRRNESHAEHAPRTYWDVEYLPESLLETYTVVQGDRIDVLAAQLLGDSRFWWILADLNREVISDTHILEPGSILQIPLVALLDSFG